MQLSDSSLLLKPLALESQEIFDLLEGVGCLVGCHGLRCLCNNNVLIVLRW